MKTDETPGIIEIIDDDSNPFGDRAQSHTVHDTGGPRWVGPVAAAALAAIIGYGVVTSASSGVPQVARAPTTTGPAPTTTIPAPTTTVAATLVPYYSARPPRQYTVSYAATNEPDPNYYGDGTYELWATDQASAGSGAWFSIETQQGASSLFALDAYRVKTDDGPIGVTHVPSGHTVLHFTSSNGAANVTMWFTPMNGTPQVIASAFAAETPTNNAPTRPGPIVHATASMRPGSTPASTIARATTGLSRSRWARPAISGTTPPYWAWRSTCVETTLDNTS